jgi:hypothetical protein
MAIKDHLTAARDFEDTLANIKALPELQRERLAGEAQSAK